MSFSVYLTNMFNTRGIAYHKCSMASGTTSFLIERRNVFDVISLLRAHNVRDVRLLPNGRLAPPGMHDHMIISGMGICLKESSIEIILCDINEQGQWLTRYQNSPISRVMPPEGQGGSFANGTFLTDRSIIFRPEKSQLRLTDDHDRLKPKDIDVVYTWVDSNDPKWLQKKSQFSDTNSLLSGDNLARYISRDELKYSLRSLQDNAPWVRKIFIVTDDQSPDWLRTSKKLVLVDHRDIFPDTSLLPVFNSHAIETCLHNIEGLAEHFIYFNDDVFLGKKVNPSHFFDEEGRSLIYASQASFIDPTIPDALRVPTDAAAYNMCELFERDFGFIPTRKMMHTPHPLRKSVLAEICAKYEREISITRAAKIRSSSDIALPSMVYPYYAWATGRAVLRQSGSTSYRYFDTGKAEAQEALQNLAKDTPHFFCANATYRDEISYDRQAKLLKKGLDTIYPRRSQFEAAL